MTDPNCTCCEHTAAEEDATDYRCECIRHWTLCVDCAACPAEHGPGNGARVVGPGAERYGFSPLGEPIAEPAFRAQPRRRLFLGVTSTYGGDEPD